VCMGWVQKKINEQTFFIIQWLKIKKKLPIDWAAFLFHARG
jgi:hypothetical protein